MSLYYHEYILHIPPYEGAELIEINECVVNIYQIHIASISFNVTRDRYNANYTVIYCQNTSPINYERLTCSRKDVCFAKQLLWRVIIVLQHSRVPNIYRLTIIEKRRKLDVSNALLVLNFLNYYYGGNKLNALLSLYCL